MLRGYLVVVMVIGIAAAMMSHAPRPHSSPPPADDVHVVRPTGGPAPASAIPLAASLQDGAVELQRDPNGHFYADVEINGTQIHMLVDTGASGIALSREDARNAGIATSIGMNDVVGEGADGSVHGEFVTIDRMALGSATAEQVPALVLNGGEQSLLGQSFLRKFALVEIHGDTMVLR